MKKILLTILILLVALGYYYYEQNTTTKNNKLDDKNSVNYRVEKNQNLIVEETTPIENSIEPSQEFIPYIESIGEDVETLATKKELTSLDKKTLKNTFITLTDFIFYNGTIKGVTFNELTNDVKQQVIAIYEKIDKKIESVYPNYKENIKETTIKTYQHLTDELLKIKDTITNNYKNEIGEENYNEQKKTFEENKETLKESFEPVIEEITEQTKKTYEKTKEEINNWYQTWKEENN